jgi:hypothetical protein
MKTFLAAVVVCVSAMGQVQPEGGGQAMASLTGFQAKSNGPAPRTADGKADLSGLWSPDRAFTVNIVAALKPGEVLPLQPWAAKVTKERLSREDPNVLCLPGGVPRMSPYPWKIVQTPTLIVFLYEGNTHSYRQIFMDGRGHPKDMDPTWFGDSTGKWDGDTLVVDTVGFNDKFWYRRTDFAHLDFEITIDDPGAYTRPFTLYGHSPLLVNTEIMEYICNENNVRDLLHIVGKDSRK